MLNSCLSLSALHLLLSALAGDWSTLTRFCLQAQPSLKTCHYSLPRPDLILRLLLVRIATS